MKRVLYLTNIEVPYRVRFFNELAKYCDLTVVYERKKSKNRNQAWAGSEQPHFRVEYLNGIAIGNENAFSFGIFKHIFARYDAVIVGCYNSPVQLLAIQTMRLFHIPFYINADGEPFLSGNGIKAKLKRLLLAGAKGYLVAGEKAAKSLSDAMGRKAAAYYFSSLSEQELSDNGKMSSQRNNTILVVGQYYDYKGLDVVIEAAKLDSSISYKIVGMGTRADLFVRECMPQRLPNVETIPFLKREELQKEYQTCAAVVLPSRQECWGLVINEAASFGTPIVSTWGSGAAVEFMSDEYARYLATPADAQDLYDKICALLNADESERRSYASYLKMKNLQYSIEASVQAHIQECDLLS